MRIPIITGPTATGKTELALELADRIDGEIISADAYQVYRYMDIGTAKPSMEERRGISHHLIDILDPSETYSAGDFFENAERCITDILNRGKKPIIAGGTGLYAETLIKGIFTGPGRDDELRESIRSEIEEKGSETVHARLASIDPGFAERVEPADVTRIIRGLEINENCGMNVRDAQREFHRKGAFEYDVFMLSDDRKRMYARIEERVDRMFDAGWEAEVKGILDMGYHSELDSFKAIGYREIASMLAGDLEKDFVVEEIKKKTRNFAKRQVTWFKRMDVYPLPAGDSSNIDIIMGINN
ncbi:tRNA (adenosine(37)-N6)-dimethylallyltransferase MiaA [Limisalsivibrio acetivorans]|uniref:tRNA (adenosine(37)-N6)-dimethylallyltransferase MiaA n=1 Tax=Limisalsivibrio acetivorans TaxID=1304888 RepID=UPI0003B3FF68|nr:tRNA (adenosine(37)-N6)-dimethylallyltransferase MiaA [Limisalsivibrio acetivorans]